MLNLHFSLKNKFKLHYIVFVSILTLLNSCDKFDGNQTIPSYIQIEKIKLVDNPNLNEGSLSHRITDAWVYVDDELIGAFELPVKFPVLKKGKHKITILPGIKMNGISGTRISYPFYKSIEINNFNLTPDSIVNIDTNLLLTSYLDYTKFAWKEDFEDGGVSLQKRSNSDTSIYKTNLSQYIFEGNYSGIVHLSSNQTFFEIETIENFILPKNGSPVFLEMNYKNNNIFMVGFLAYYSNTIKQVATITLYPTTEWKKIYINLTPDLANEYNASSFKIFFGHFKHPTVNEAIILLDNIKLVHFNTNKNE